MFSDSCVVNELPLLSAARLDTSASVQPPGPDLVRFPFKLLVLSCSCCGQFTCNPLLPCQLQPDLQLTEEEQKLLNQEGVSLPNNLPLTKVTQHAGQQT